MTDKEKNNTDQAINHSDFLHYSLGMNDQHGYKIESIIGKNKNFIVYLTNKGHLKWDVTDEIQEKHGKAIALASIHSSRIHTSLRKKQKKEAMWMIGHALYISLYEKDYECNEDNFKSAITYIETAQEESLHGAYIFASFIISVGFILLAIIMKEYKFMPDYQIIVTAAMAGTVGGFVSILQRFREIEIYHFSASKYIALRSTVRTLVGSIFGVLIYIASEGKLLPEVVHGVKGSPNQYDAMYFFAFISGFSERFIPDLISKFTSKYKNTNHKE